MKRNNLKQNVILSETKNLMRSFTFVQDDRESGRSMVEMLGVLAVMGVLSVAGIAGYNTAMNQHRANEAVNRAMRAAVMLSAQRLANPSATLSTSGLDSAITVGNDTDKLVLTLSNVDEKVRSRIEAMGFKNATISSGENGALTFTFNNDLSERSGNTGGNSGTNQQQSDLCANVTCQNGGTCSGGVCDCTGTAYTGDHCETPEQVYDCPAGNYSSKFAGTVTLPNATNGTDQCLNGWLWRCFNNNWITDGPCPN